jgi:hypothetical protein
MNAEDERYKRWSAVSDRLVLERICGKLLDSFGNIQIEEMFLRVMEQNKHWIEDTVVSYKDGLLSVFQKKCICNLDNFKFVGL